MVVKILATAAVVALVAAGVGLVCGLIYAVGGLIIDLLTTGLNWGTLMAFGAIIGMPVLFALFGFVVGAVIAAVVEGVRAGRRSRGCHTLD